MPYRRSRSYRSAPRLYRRSSPSTPRPGRTARPGFALTAGLLAVALAAALTTALNSRPRPALSAAGEVVNSHCDIIVPAHPLTAVGLATPYRLTGPNAHGPEASGCTEANAASLGAFVQATILNPATGALSVYEPLVITQGSRPAAPPVVPQLPAGAIVTIDIGFNGGNLRQIGATPQALQEGNCVNGLPGSIFGQVSFCNGAAFFRAAYQAEASGKLHVPGTGISPVTKQPCPTTRSFTLVDQDPSDNVTTRYLLTADGRTAQFTQRNAAALPGAAQITNGSDNALLDDFVDPALGCKPFEAPDLSNGGAPGTSQALDELSAAHNQAAPAALVPENDPMTRARGTLSPAKTNLYRTNVGQPPISPSNTPIDGPQAFCTNMIRIQASFLQHTQPALTQSPTPVPAIGTNLFTFMASRLMSSFANLRCRHYGLTDPIRIIQNKAGVAVAAGFGRSPHPPPLSHPPLPDHAHQKGQGGR